MSYMTCNFIPIPKNASTYVESFFNISLGSKSIENFKYGKPLAGKKTIVILRDPLDRWVSGITQHFWARHKMINDLSDSGLLWKYITNQYALDEHTELQSRFLETANTDDLTFFKQGPDLEKSIRDFVKFELNVKEEAWIDKRHLLNYNKSSNAWSKSLIKDYLSAMLRTDADLVEKIKKFYKHDYDLINTVKFYKKSEDTQ